MALTTATFVTQAAKKQGRRVILSVGGADGSFPITSQNVDAFTKSLGAVIDEYDFVCGYRAYLHLSTALLVQHELDTAAPVTAMVSILTDCDWAGRHRH
jgi:chitinase